jgi:transcriptional regulator with XRE-family HTH domain
MKIAVNLMILRNEMRMTHKEFAKELGVSDRTVRRWMSGKREPSLKHLKIIVDRFKIDDVYQFVYGDKPKDIPKLVYL